MKILTRKKDNVIIMSCSIGVVDEAQNAIKLEDDSYMGPVEDFNIYDVPEDFVFEPIKQCYDGANLTANENYVEPPLTQEEELQRIKEKQELMQKAIDELIFGGVL